MDDLVLKAYKKLKSFAYYDKNAFYLKSAIIDFEDETKDVDGYLKSIVADFDSGKNTDNQPEPVIMPKSVECDKDSELSFNAPRQFYIDKVQYYSSISVRDGVIAMMWSMAVGQRMDASLSDECYGNRIGVSYGSWSPHLFKPYPFQYSMWRDKGLEAAIRCSEEGNSCAFISSDFSSFYYSLSLNDDIKKKIRAEFCNSDFDRKLTQAVFDFIDGYSVNFNESHPLPIGYPPSNILANYLLSNLDKAIHDKVLPVYYGRYVDDIILVVRCNPDDCVGSNPLKMLQTELEKSGLKIGIKSDKDGNLEDITVGLSGESDIELTINNEKTRCEIIDKDYSASQLKILKKNVDANSSEFRYMPYEDIGCVNDHLSIFKESALNVYKPGEMGKATVSRYGLSKYLGKCQMMLSLVKDDSRTKGFSKSLMRTLSDDVLLGNWSLWERILQTCVINGSPEDYVDVVKRLIKIV